MNHSNIRFLSFASLSLFVALAPLACGSDDDDDVVGTAGKTSGGSSSTAGKTSTGGSSTTGGSSSTGGSLGQAGDDTGVGANGGEAGAGGAPAAAKSRLRVVHASPNAPAVDVYVAGTTTAAVENLAYGKATDFIEVDAGDISFDLRAAGAAATDDPAFTTEAVTIEGDSDYTLVAAGDFVNADDADTGFRILPLQHDFEPADDGLVQTRIVHAASAWGDVDLDLVDTDDVDLPGLPRFGSESNVSLPAGTAFGVEFENTDGVLSQLSVPKLTAGGELFVIATGNPGFPFRAPANGFALLVVDQDGKTSWVKENPWIHVLHASDIGEVDVYSSASTSTLLADDVEGGSLAAFQLAASTPGFTLRAVDSGAANGAASALASGGTSTLVAGEHYLSYIAGSAIGTIEEGFDLEQPEKVMLRGVHAVKAGQITSQLDFGAVTAEALSSALISGVAPAGSSAAAGVAIDAGDLVLGAAAKATTTPLFATIALSGNAAPVAGERDFVLLTGATQATAKLYVVNTAVAGWSVR